MPTPSWGDRPRPPAPSGLLPGLRPRLEPAPAGDGLEVPADPGIFQRPLASQVEAVVEGGIARGPLVPGREVPEQGVPRRLGRGGDLGQEVGLAPVDGARYGAPSGPALALGLLREDPLDPPPAGAGRRCGAAPADPLHHAEPIPWRRDVVDLDETLRPGAEDFHVHQGLERVDRAV